MNKIEDKGLIIKAADVKINTEALNSVNGNFILDSILTNKIEGSSINKSSKYVELNKEIINTNHFLLMLQFAFNQHKPISISPDNIWLLICQGFSEHIKLNSEDFKDIIGVNEKQTIQVRRDDFVIGEDNPWEQIFPEFTNKITQTINEGLYSNIVLEFSTSTEKEINAFEIAFMDSMSNYFDYEFASLCGIPEIEIKGTIEDYIKIINAIEELKKYNLEWWISSVTPNINKIIQTLKGESNTDFWNSIYKENNESGGPFITGWIADFFPYLKTSITEQNGSIDFSQQSISKDQILKTIQIDDLNFDNYKIHKVQIRNPRLTNSNDSKLKLDDFPSGLSIVPFKWNYIDKEFDMNFVSGFMGIKESELNNSLNTDINWIVNRK
ncbi:DUF4419 domain-containing protein [Aquimarina sp. AD1]|uniref:DUF4419 domain-containing protein n=1 Tax=Aquimarina sp. (strain AD1) TaxID=1714848 RepID=UPI000E5286EC|nr:DUF4419 domain-containing protein [Aquimarina sp. AD1]AXT54621.1 DUF4419 domain-containing protein [Aquimarina sp. AD1]RKN14731.1 DUF4419 domain-containing protein [Aquimarina sp. AD1]